MINLDTRLTRTGSNVSCDVDNEVAILDLSEETYYGMNDVGALIWEKLKSPVRVRDLVDAVKVEYDVDAAECESDVLELCEDLVNHKLVGISNE